MTDEKLAELKEETTARVERARKIAEQAAAAGMDKKALGVEIIEVAGKVDYADFLVVMTGTSDRHCAAIARGVDEDLSKAGTKPASVEGLSPGEWVLIDFFDVVVHVFTEQTRDLYDLSGLWMDASRMRLPTRHPPAAAEDSTDSES